MIIKIKSIEISLIILVLLGLVIPPIPFLSQIENQVSASETKITQEPLPESLPEAFSLPGRIEATGTYFEIKESEYITVTLKSNEEITIALELTPEMISLNIGSSTNSTSANLTIGGLIPRETYYKYQDSFENEAVFVSDENGSYTWTQDLIQFHHVWIQKEKEPILSSEDCSNYDNLDNSTLTSTLKITTTPLSIIYVPDDYLTIQSAVDAATTGDTIIVRDGTYIENINLNKENLTVKSENGADKTIIQAADSNNNVFKITADYVTIDGFTIKGGSSGVYIGERAWLKVADYSTISNNNILGNNKGISLADVFWCSPYGWPCFIDGSDVNLITNNVISNSNIGIELVRISNNNTIKNNNISNSSFGIWLYESWGNKFTNNIISNNGRGIQIIRGYSNIILDNTISNNSNYGFFFLLFFWQQNIP